jgi:DNA-binding response OmpR family regulator
VGKQHNVGKKQDAEEKDVTNKQESDAILSPGEGRETPGREKACSSARLVIDTSMPGTVIFEGKSVKLTPLPYNLLLLLATKSESGATYREIDEIVWPETKVERQQVSAHRAAIIRAFSKLVGKTKAKKLIETRSGFGLILQIPSCDIKIKRKH